MTDYVADVEVRRDDVIVTLEWIGEGWDGDYQDDDPEDCPLLRFSVYRAITDPQDPRHDRDEFSDASYCTRIPATVPQNTAQQLAVYILDTVYEPAHDGHSIKKLCERLSWIEPTWLTQEVAE